MRCGFPFADSHSHWGRGARPQGERGGEGEGRGGDLGEKGGEAGGRTLVLCQLLAAGRMFRLAGFGRRHLPLHRVVATGGAKHGGLLGSEYPTTGPEDRNMMAVYCGDTTDMRLFQPSQEDVCNLRLEAACMPTMPEGILKQQMTSLCSMVDITFMNIWK
uniref:Uncharacterized protein n=1 Tax=Oryza barthii TaxID=65489 RepID=A0A0D3F364_9ORYZ